MTLSLPFLTLLSLCAVIATLAVCFLVWDIHTTLRRIRRMLPDVQKTFHHASRALGYVEHILAAADHATARLGTFMQHAGNIASNVFERVAQAKSHMKKLLQGHGGNGTRVGPRRRRENHRGG